MGLEIKKNKKGLYSLKSTNSGESYHEDKKWITENEAKKILISTDFWNFIEKSLKIYMDFPNGYSVNDKREFDKTKLSFNDFYINSFDDGNIDEVLISKFKEMMKELDLKIDFKD